MRKSTSSPPPTLTAAIAAWNSKAKETSAPVLHHIFASIHHLQRLRAAIRHCTAIGLRPLEKSGPVATSESTTDPVDTLQTLCTRLDQFEALLAQLSAQAHAASAQGETLIEDFLALPLHGDGGSELKQRFQLHRDQWSENGSEKMQENGIHALDRLIDAQKSEIDALNQQLEEAESWMEVRSYSRSTDSPRSFGQIELQSVQEFVQNSPIASIPINASYYQRILEAAESPEGHKIPMGKILTGAGVVSERQLQSALDYQREGRRQALGSLLVDLGYTTEDAIAQALAAQLALPYVVLVNEPVDAAAVSSIPVHLARRHASFPLNFNGHALCVAMANPLDLIALEDLRIASNRHIRPCVAARGEIASHIERFYSS